METEKKDIENTLCVCAQSTGLFIPNRQLSYYIALSILFLFLIFMTGFFWGKQTALKTCLYNLEQDFFADQISYSIYRSPDTFIQITDKQEDKCSEYNNSECNNEEETESLEDSIGDSINENEILTLE